MQPGGERFNVYVRFISNPFDVRRLVICDRICMDKFDQLVREAFGTDYVHLPDKMVYYVKKRLAHGESIVVKAETPLGFFYDDALITAYGKWEDEDWVFPSYISKRMENRIFNPDL